MEKILDESNRDRAISDDMFNVVKEFKDLKLIA